MYMYTNCMNTSVIFASVDPVSDHTLFGIFAISTQCVDSFGFVTYGWRTLECNMGTSWPLPSRIACAQPIRVTWAKLLFAQRKYTSFSEVLRPLVRSSRNIYKMAASKKPNLAKDPPQKGGLYLRCVNRGLAQLGYSTFRCNHPPPTLNGGVDGQILSDAVGGWDGFLISKRQCYIQ